MYLLCDFCHIISKPVFTNKSEQKHKNVLSVLFLGWYTHCCIAGNPIALLHDLRRLQPQHIYIEINNILFPRYSWGLSSANTKAQVLGLNFTNMLFPVLCTVFPFSGQRLIETVDTG